MRVPTNPLPTSNPTNMRQTKRYFEWQQFFCFFNARFNSGFERTLDIYRLIDKVSLLWLCCVCCGCACAYLLLFIPIQSNTHPPPHGIRFTTVVCGWWLIISISIPTLVIPTYIVFNCCAFTVESLVPSICSNNE